MLYIFHVDTGRMMTFEMNLALESVVQLKEVIERACRIPADKQVLLVSGGESLDPNARVCSYSAGADTNPIFLFSKCTIESMTPPTLSSEYASDARLKEHVEGSHGLPDTYTTVVTRVKLAQQFCDHARDLTRGCERLVHDQHLQQQGWAAVLANLEDSTSAFRARAELFQQNYNQYLGTRQDFIQLLQNFREDLSLLAKIPIVPALLEVIDSGSIKSDSSTTSGAGGKVLVRESEEEVQPKDPVTLLQWISAKDNQSSLQQVAEHCMRGLEQNMQNLQPRNMGVSHSPKLTNPHQVSPSPTETSPRQIGRTGSRRRIHSRGLGNDDCLGREPNQRLAQALKKAVANLTSQTSAPGMFQFSLAITGTSALGPERCSPPFLLFHVPPLLPPFTENLFVFDERVMDGLKSEVEQVLSAANKTGMKEIKGLEERLFGLEQLMFETKTIVQEQGDLAQSFLQNQTRANNLGDPSILPDLCASHRRQLQVMLNNHQHLVDIRNRCSRAKEELCHNLHMRLKWVMYVENGMCDVNSKLVIYHENLKRLRRHLEVVQQIHLAPQMYVTAVGEVVRRRTFSQAFLMWASDLACHFLAVHNEEVTRRRDFQSQFDGHFLNTLFPGMEDFPPPFATQAPSIFDSGLPKLSLEDIHLLKQELPELTFSLTLPDLESITQFFLIKSVAGTLKSESKEETSTLEDHIAKVVTESGLVRNLGPTLLQQIDSEKSLLGFESETDTEEFEKLGQSPVELRFDSKQTAAVTGHVTEAQMGDPSVIATLEVGVPADKRSLPSLLLPSTPSTHSQALPPTPQEFVTADFYIDESMPSSYSESSHNVQVVPELQRQLERGHSHIGCPPAGATYCLQENLGSTRNEVERVQNLLEAASRVMREAVANLRDDLALLRSKTALERDEVLRLCRDLAAGLAGKQQEIVAGQVLRERELIQRLTVDHELEMVNLKQDTKVDIDAKDEKIKELKQCIEKKEQELATLRADMERRLEEEVRERREVSRSFESQLYECRTLCGELQQQLDAADREKVRELKDQCDKLTQDYKAEVESLRSRFRMALDCSPSDSSLEKIERSNLCAEKEAAVKTAIEQERARWQATLEQKIKIVKTRADAEKQVWFNEAMRRVVGEKDRQLDAARAREVSLIEECHRHQETIRRLTDEQGAGPMSLGAEPGDVLERLSNLESVNARLKTELAEEREKNSSCLPSMTADNASSDVKMSTTSSSDMSTSVAVVQEGVSRDVATSPEPIQQTLQEELEIKERLVSSYMASKIVLLDPNTILKAIHTSEKDRLSVKQIMKMFSVGKTKVYEILKKKTEISKLCCNAGDSVLVVWDENHRNYTILQEGNTLYFLHSDCLETMDLKPGCDGMPTRLYSTGEVINKEYCQAKKSENRYRVPKGTKFYRVKVRPLAKDSVLIRGHHHHHHHHSQLSLLPFTAPSSLLSEAAK
uniref:RB1-inducible coiled-coil protein 1 n=1 Tax=Timema douglasi TaxID=61478 RepID=A0A7R8VBD1_TIMDO|nr:unnamed protein product [Timema douglasi]